MQTTIHLARERLAIIAAIIGDFVGGFFALSFYFTVLIPFSLIARHRDDALQRHPATNSNWLEREPVPNSLDQAKRQG